jgi:drug/metabolite transporter (DMT)-like permease
MTFYLPIVLMALATALYHVAQKSVPAQISPMLSLVVNYTSALVLTLLILPFYPHVAGASWSLREVNWASYAVGVSIVGVELAVLLAYRAGWRISLASVVGNVATALLLVVVGLLYYHERLSGKNLAGVALCLVGLILVVQP